MARGIARRLPPELCVAAGCVRTAWRVLVNGRHRPPRPGPAAAQLEVARADWVQTWAAMDLFARTALHARRPAQWMQTAWTASTVLVDHVRLAKPTVRTALRTTIVSRACAYLRPASNAKDGSLAARIPMSPTTVRTTGLSA